MVGTMFATVRESTFDPDKLSRGRAQLEEFGALRDQQPGFAGAVTVDAGNGRLLTLVLWESEEHATAATTRLDPEAQRLLAPLWTIPSRVIAQGPVVRSDLIRS